MPTQGVALGDETWWTIDFEGLENPDKTVKIENLRFPNHYLKRNSVAANAFFSAYNYGSQLDPRLYKLYRTCTVTFVDEDGTTILDEAETELGKMPVYGGPTPTKAATPQYTYSFAGWSTSPGGSLLNPLPAADADVTYYAVYDETVNEYTITWLDDDNSVIDETTVAYGTVPTHADASKDPTAQYTYTFTGWSPTPEAVTGEATYMATYSTAVNRYTVTFEDWDGTPITAEEYPYGTQPDDIVLPSAPQRAATDEYAYTFAGWNPALEEVTEAATYTAMYTPHSLAAATWCGGRMGDWDNPDNWDIGYVPTSATVVTFMYDEELGFTNIAEVGIDQAKCKEIVLADNAYVSIIPESGVSDPLLHFSGNGGKAVSGSGTLAVNYIGLFNDNYSGELTIGPANDQDDLTFEILNDITFRGNASGSPAASFVITGKTTVSADAWVKSIDRASTLFAEGIDVAKGVTAYMKTLNYGRTKIGWENVTLVANDDEGNPTAIWLMQSGASLNYGAGVVVDADHAADYYVNTREDRLEGGTYTVYEALPKPTVVSVSATGATITGVTSGQRVVPGKELTIGATGLAVGYEAVLVITKHSDGSELVNTKELPCAYTMPDFDIDVTMTAVPDPDFSGKGDGTEYTINNTAGWGKFCDALANNTKGYFSGKTVKLAGDIGSAESPVTRMAGSSDHPFSGTFDGGGHTLCVSLSSTYGQDYTAPFSYVSNPGDAADSPAAIRNLKVAGNVESTYKFASGLVGGCWYVVDIENCLVSTVIDSRVNGEGSHGGIVGRQGSGTLTIRGCAFDGQLLGSGTNSCAGFVGKIIGGTLNITNSLFAPASVSVSAEGSATFAPGDAASISNCYYTEALGTAQGKEAYTAPAAPVGEPTAETYTVSGITAYANGLVRGETFYYGGGDNVSISFVNENGGNGTHEATVLDATADLSSYSVPANFAERWFVVEGAGVSLGTFEIYGTTHIILCDGADITFTNTGSDWTIYHGGTLNIYGQDGGTGRLTAASGDYHDAIHCHDLGGIASTIPGNLNIYGGQVTATCASTGKGISVAGTATLGWTRAANSISANSYEGTIKIADGQSLHNGSEVLSGTVSDMSKLDGKTLIGVDVLEDAATNDIAALATRLDGKQTNVALADRTLYKDGAWNTLCLSFDVEDGNTEDGADLQRHAARGSHRHGAGRGRNLRHQQADGPRYRWHALPLLQGCQQGRGR